MAENESTLRKRIAELEKRAEKAEETTRTHISALSERDDQIAQLSAVIASNQRELEIRRGAHPMYDRDPGSRNQYADRTVIETQFSTIFAKTFGLPPAIVLGEFKKRVADCLSRNYPKLRRSAARAIMRGSFASLGRGPVGEAPSAHYRRVEDTLVMLDILETLAYECSQQTETIQPAPGEATSAAIDSDSSAAAEEAPAEPVRTPATPLEPAIDEPTAQEAEAIATSQ